MGLQAFLDTTTSEHNGVDYKMFAKLYDNNVNPANIARLVGKNRQTVVNWISAYKAEQGIKVVAQEPE